MKSLLTLASVVLGLSACAMTPKEVVISHMPGYSSAPEWITVTGGDEKDIRFQVGMAEADGNALTSSVVKLAEREARRSFASSAVTEVESFARDELGMNENDAQQIAQETVKLKTVGVRIEKTYWEKVADVTEKVSIRAWAYATMPQKEFNEAITAAKARMNKKQVVSEDTKARADKKWEQAEE